MAAKVPLPWALMACYIMHNRLLAISTMVLAIFGLYGSSTLGPAMTVVVGAAWALSAPLVVLMATAWAQLHNSWILVVLMAAAWTMLTCGSANLCYALTLR